MSLDIHRILVTSCLILSFVLGLSASGLAASGRAALLKSGLPGDDPALIDSLAGQLTGAGYDVRTIDAGDICSPDRLTSSNFDLLVLPNAAALPAKATGPIDGFLRAGGDIVALNAPLWQTAYIKTNDGWITRDDFQKSKASTLPPHVLYDFKSGAASDWRRASDNDRSPPPSN